MRKLTTVKPKILNLFNRDFGNLKQYVIDDLEEEFYQEYKLNTVARRLFEYSKEEAIFFNQTILTFLDEKYKQKIEDYLQLVVMSNDIILRNQYNDTKRSEIRCSRKGKTTIDLIMESFLSEDFIRYLCDEELGKVILGERIGFTVNRLATEYKIGTIFFCAKEEIGSIILSDIINKKINNVIQDEYPELIGKNKSIQTRFICKVLITADILINCDCVSICMLSKQDKRYIKALTLILSKIDAWRNQLFFYSIRYSFQLYSEKLENMENILEKYEREFSKEEKEEFDKFLEDNFLINISFGLLFYDSKAITIFYGLDKQKQNIIKNFVVKVVSRLKEKVDSELEKFNIHDLEKENVSEETKEIASKVQIYMWNHKWLEKYVRDNQVKKKAVSVKSWNMYMNVNRTILEYDVTQEDFFESPIHVARKILNIQKTFSLNNLCEREIDKDAFWYVLIMLKENEISKEDFIASQLKKGVSKELINLYYSLIE